MTLTQAQINELCDFIVGTTKFIDDGLQAMELNITENDLDSETLALIDEKVFICDTCGWTCDIDEMGTGDDGQICVECEDSDS